MTKNDALVSIITPSLNQGRFIRETLLSVKSQDYPYIEHIVIDGGSTDDTLMILKRYEGTYNLRWISEPDEGHSDALNKGFRMAQGEIIGWLNSDDVYFDRGTVRAVVEAFQKHPDADIVYGDCAYIWEDGTVLRIQCVPGFRYNRLLRGCFLAQPAVFFRRHVVEKHQLDKRLKVAIDYEYWLRIGREYHFYHVPRILAADRNHRGRISIASREKLLTTATELRKQYLPNPTWKHRLEWQADKVFSGIPRRIKGLVLLLFLTRKQDWAFDAKVVLNCKIIKYQLLGARIEDLEL
ncbi:MAG: glycosyltransferase family 2 protein [Candidatus Methanomethyliaceae archaeon]